MIDSALIIGREMGFELRRVGRGRVEKCVQRAGWGWKGSEGWEGVEIWRGRYKGHTAESGHDGEEEADA